MAEIGKGGIYVESDQQVARVYGVCNTSSSTYFGDRYKINSGEFLGTLSQGQVTSNCGNAAYDCSNAWCKSRVNNNDSLVSQYQKKQDNAEVKNKAASSYGTAGQSNDTWSDGDNGGRNVTQADADSIKSVDDSQSVLDRIGVRDDDNEEDSFAGEYDESTNDPNKTYKNIYWIDRTKDNHKIPENLRGRFWTHIQAGFLTEQDKKTNYNVRAIGDDNYPQNHFGTVSDGIDESDDVFIGDISEYNSAELTERILENSYHRINTVYREYRKEILNLSSSGAYLERKYDGYFKNPETKIFTHNFNSTNVSVSFFSKSSKVSMDSWPTISYKILNNNKVEVRYNNSNNSSDPGHGVITTITYLGPNAKKYDEYFSNDQTKVFTHNFGTENISVNFFSKTSKVSMDNWDSVKYEIVDRNRVKVRYYSTKNNNGHSFITTITNLSPNPDDEYEVGNLKEGYLYKPHYRIKIREYESIITVEDDDADFVDIPSYATLQSTRREVNYNSFVNGEKTYKDNTPLNMINDPVFKTVNTYRYRRLLDIGEIDVLGFGVDYPFNSGAHYIYVDSRFYLQRQDPPFKPYEEIVSLKLPANVKLFEYLVKSPNYKRFDIVSGGDIDSEVLDGTKDPLEVDVTINGSEGNYELGERYVVGKELSVPTIKTKDLDDVC